MWRHPSPFSSRAFKLRFQWDQHLLRVEAEGIVRRTRQDHLHVLLAPEDLLQFRNKEIRGFRFQDPGSFSLKLDSIFRWMDGWMEGGRKVREGGSEGGREERREGGIHVMLCHVT